MQFLILLFVLVKWQSAFCQEVKNEAEVYMLKELSLLKWQEKTTILASADNTSKIEELQKNVATLEENLNTER